MSHGITKQDVKDIHLDPNKPGKIVKTYSIDPNDPDVVVINGYTRLKFDLTVNRIAANTDNNYHVGALIAGCQLLGLDHLVKLLEHVRSIQELEGCIPPGLDGYRYSLYCKMRDYAKEHLSERDYKKFYDAF